VIACAGLSVRFPGEWAVADASFEVPSGSICGFIGPNGAGKTTTIRVLSTTLSPTGGSVRMLGLDLLREGAALRRRIGWMPDSTSLYPELTLREYLEFFGRFYGLGRSDSRQRATACMELTRMEGFADRGLRGLSRGERQRVSLARSLIHNPDLLLLDEPAEGLDPGGRVELKELLKLLQERGKTIFISSHVLSDLEETCTDLIFIRDGRIAAAGSMAAFQARRRARRQYRLFHLESAERMAEATAGVRGVSLVDSGPGWVDLEVPGDDSLRAAALAGLVRAGVRISEFSPKRGLLEEEFLRLQEETPP
jgi:ABC-2 type transport system ATP-binding protein